MCHHTSMALSHAAPTTSNSSCPVTQCQTPSQGGRRTCAVSTTPRSHLSQGFSTTTGRGFAPSSGTVMQLLEGMWLFGFCLLHTPQLHLALVPTPCAAPATPPMAPLQHPEQCHTQRPRALERKSHSPLNISVHQQPDQYPCHSHQDWVMVHTLQPYGSKRER